jgi:hypothetical protein
LDKSGAFPEAAQKYRRAADQGYALGQRALGLLYSSGQGVEQDDVKAAQWLAKQQSRVWPSLKVGSADGLWTSLAMQGNKVGELYCGLE